MSEYIINNEPMDPRLVSVPAHIGLKDLSYRTGPGPSGKWEITDGGVREAFLFIVRRVYPNAILVGNQHDADQTLKDGALYQKYLDLQPPDYGEQEYYRYHANGDRSELIQAHIPQDLAVEFKAICRRKRLKIKEVLATMVAEWLEANGDD